jgi:peroxiredoxin
MKTKFALLCLIALFCSAVSGGDAPNFKLKNLKKQDLELQKVLEKGPVLLDFWATWCKPCLKAFPRLNELHKKYSDKGLTILGINEDGNRNQSKIKPFVKSYNIEFEVLIDENNDVMRKYQVSMLPSAVLISQDGKIVSSSVGSGADKFKQLEAQIKLLLQNND